MAVPARHTFGRALGYIIELDGRKIYFTGDTKLHKGLERIGAMGIDVMLMPYGGSKPFGTIWSPAEAARAAGIVNPAHCIPIHWGTFGRWWSPREPENPGAFEERMRAANPRIAFHILEVGGTFRFQETNVLAEAPQ